MKRVLIGIGILAALLVVGYVVQAVTPRSSNGVVAVAPPSPVPSPVQSPIPSPVVLPSPVPTPVESPLPSPIPTPLPSPTPASSPVPVSSPPVVGAWTSLGTAGSTQVWRRCDGHTTLYVAAGILTAVAGGC